MKVDTLKIKDAITPVVEGLGYELIDVRYSVDFGTDTISVIIYKDGDMGLDDCERVHNAVDGVFDDINPLENGYNLQVSSMGLDWPLKTNDDFRRRMGKDLEISLFKKLDGQKKLTGILKSFDDESIVLSLTDIKNGKDLKKELVLSRKDIAKASLAIRFE